MVVLFMHFPIKDISSKKLRYNDVDFHLDKPNIAIVEAKKYPYYWSCDIILHPK